MENLEVSSHVGWKRMVKTFPELEQWTKKDIKIIKEFLRENSVVLEVGCGWGRVIKPLAKYCKKFVGIDISDTEIEEAKRHLRNVPNAELYLEDGKKTHFPDEHFDIIIAMGNTFGNLDTAKEEVLEEMKRLIKKDGKILISVWKKGIRAKRVEAYKKAGLKIKESEEGKIVFDAGLVSEEFSEKELRKIIENKDLKAKFIEISSAVLFCVAEKFS